VQGKEARGVVTASGWGRVAVVMACVVAAGRLDRGRAARVRVAVGLACLASRRCRSRPAACLVWLTS
jgi:hypothetical protein